MKLPSIKRLESFFPGKGKQIRHLLESDSAVDESPAVVAWVKQCYHPPKMREKRLEALNEAIGGHGVEAVFDGDSLWPRLEYINTGDLYNATIYRLNGAYKVGCVADIHHLIH